MGRELPEWLSNGVLLYNDEFLKKGEKNVRILEIPREHFYAKVGTIKDRNGMDLTEAEDIKNRWQEYTEELYKKVFMTQIITMV